MKAIDKFGFEPSETDCEKASYSYIMSLVAVIAGLPIPIINLLATIIFFLSHRKENKFVKWHCTQALVGQLFLFFFNSYSFWWTISIVLGEKEITSAYIGYLIFIFVLNILELISNLISAIKSRKGEHFNWLFFSSITDLIVKP